MLAFGAEDFTRDIGAARSREGREQFVARSMVVLGAKAAGVLASDTVWSDLEDVEGLTNSAQEARELGFDGKGAIHPAQTELINKIFSPSEDEIANARAIVTAFNEATARGSSVIALGRKMIDPPVVARAQRILALAEKLLK
jgi:citrate lyase subunit beta/citryl-CoA lyase